MTTVVESVTRPPTDNTISNNWDNKWYVESFGIFVNSWKINEQGWRQNMNSIWSVTQGNWKHTLSVLDESPYVMSHCLLTYLLTFQAKESEQRQLDVAKAVKDVQLFLHMHDSHVYLHVYWHRSESRHIYCSLVDKTCNSHILIKSIGSNKMCSTHVHVNNEIWAQKSKYYFKIKNS